MTTPEQWQTSLFAAITENQAKTHDAFTKAQQAERDALRTWMTANPPVATTTPPVTQPPVTQPPVTQPPVTQPPPTTTAKNRPANPAAIVYGSGLSNASAWAKPGALVIAGRDNYAGAWAKTIADGGGTVLVYLDTIISAKAGRYHDKLLNASEFGAAVPLWPGNYVCNQYGSLNDFRSGGILQTKLRGVMELIVKENPHVSGIFLDDCGSRSWFPNFDWNSWTSANKEAYRNGAIDICKTARSVADANNLFIMVNGSWAGNSNTTNGDGGYPNRGQHGISIADGGFWENHGYDAYGVAYGKTGQWGAQTPRKLPYMWYSNVNDAATRDKWISADCAAFASNTDYGASSPVPFKAFTDFGLPNRKK